MEREPETAGPSAPRVRSAWRWPLAALLVAAAAAGLVRAEGIRPVRIVSGSMVPAVGVGDWIVVRNHDRDARRGEIVLFRFPLGTTGQAIKRVVAVGGDRVAIAAHSVTVNSQVITIAGAPSATATGSRVETVPAGSVFLLGDNAAHSIDSRSFGPIPETELIGRVMVVIPAWSQWAAAVVLVLCGLVLVMVRRQR